MTTPQGSAREWMHDGLVQSVATAANLVGGVVVAWLATQVLSTSDFGVFAWATATVTYLGFFGRFGGIQASTISLQQTSSGDRYGRERAFLAVTILGSIIVGLVWVLGVGIIAAVSNAVDSLGVALILVGVWLPITALVPTIGGILRGRGQFRRSALIAEYVRKLTVIAALIAFVITDRSDVENLLIWVVALDLVVAVVAGFLFGRPEIPSAELVQDCARESASFAVMSIGAASVPAAGLVVVGFLIETSELALLGVALRIFGFVAAGYAVLVRVATPRIARAYSEGVLLELGPLIRRFAFLAASAQLAATAAFLILGRSALRIAFGDFYVDAYAMTLLLLAGSVVNTFFGPAMLTLTCTGDRWFVARARVLSAALFTAASAVLGVAVGGIGIAVCFVVTITVFNVVMWHRAKQTVGLDTAARWERRESVAS